MKNISSKKYLLLILTIPLMVGCILIPYINFQIDPLQAFRSSNADTEGLYPRRYHNYSKIKYDEYEYLFMGTSMLNSLSEFEAEKILNSKIRKVNMAGSSSLEQSILVNLALREKNKVKVVWELNLDMLSLPSRSLPHVNQFPAWLYKEGMGFDTFFKYLMSYDTLKKSKKSYKSLKKVERRDNQELYKTQFTKKDGIQYLEREKRRGKEIKSRGYENILDSFRNNIITILEKYPDSEFIFYFPPKTNFYFKRYELVWDDGNERFLNIKRAIMKDLVQRENVKLFDFQADLEIVNNPSLFYDVVHHKSIVFTKILNNMKSLSYLVTLNNLETYLEKLESIFIDRKQD